jgi:GntR family transcriptional regulator
MMPNELLKSEWLAPVAASPLPLHAQLRERLRERILDGSYAVHAQLPPESTLGALFGVSRITVRQALGDLHKEGLICKVPGKGTFVAKPKAFQQLSQLEGFAQAMARLGHSISNVVTSHRSVAADAAVARQLDLAVGAPVSEIRRIRCLNGDPLSVEVTYLPLHIGERLRHADLAQRDIFLILENDFGIALGHADLRIDAVPADAGLAGALRVAEGSAILRIERLTHSTGAGGEPVPLDFEYLYFRGDAFQYRLRIHKQ